VVEKSLSISKSTKACAFQSSSESLADDMLEICAATGKKMYFYKNGWMDGEGKKLLGILLLIQHKKGDV
jgi:hypothetical protein